MHRLGALRVGSAEKDAPPPWESREARQDCAGALQGVLPAEVLHRRAGLSLEEGAEARRRAEAHLFGYFGHGEVGFAEEALCVFDDPVVDCVQHRESRFALEVLGEVGMRCAARLRDALDGELPRVRRTDEVNRRGDMRIRRREASCRLALDDAHSGAEDRLVAVFAALEHVEHQRHRSAPEAVVLDLYGRYAHRRRLADVAFVVHSEHRRFARHPYRAEFEEVHDVLRHAVVAGEDRYRTRKVLKRVDEARGVFVGHRRGCRDAQHLALEPVLGERLGE